MPAKEPGYDPGMAKARDIPGLHAGLPFREAAVATIRVRAGEVFDMREDVLDTGEIERVHRMRVSTRRLRAVMELYRPCFEKATFKPLLRDVKALADALGARRDPDVQLDALTTLAAALPKADLAGLDLVADELRAEQQEGNELLAVALAEVERSDLHGRLLAMLDDVVSEPAADDDVDKPHAEPADAYPAEAPASVEPVAASSGEDRPEEVAS